MAACAYLFADLPHIDKGDGGQNSASDKKCDFNGIGCNKVIYAGSPSAFYLPYFFLC